MAGLQRIILIDTHLPGVVELKLDGHTNICGTNASGKTTLQRLIPVFYGEYPSRVVPATRDSFERWYLPRTSSFIIYEYTRAEGELCQVVLTSTGNGVNYRLIGKPFVLEDYLYKQKNGDHASVSATELARSLKRNDILVSSQLTTKDFRAVLQNDQGVLNQSANARELLGYARVFSLCKPSEHIRHIEKLAKAVHSKEGKMETIKSMIAAILEEDGVQPPSSSLSRNRVDDWIRECQLIQSFELIKPEFAKLEQANLALTDAEQKLAELNGQLEHDKTYLEGAAETLSVQLTETGLKRKQADNDWQSLRDELNQTVSSARADVDKYTNELDAVESEFDHWQSQDIEQLKEDVGQLGTWHNELASVQSRYGLLTEKHQDIESSFNRRMAQMGESLALAMETLSERHQQADAHKQQQVQQERESLQSIRQDFSAQLQRLNDQHQTRLSELKVTQAELNSNLSNAGFNEFEQTQLDILDATIKQATVDEDSARSELRRCQQQHSKTLKAREEANQALSSAHQQTRLASQALDDVNALLYPGAGSLLEYLRQNLDDWENSLGKVIRPELLKRTDLSPAVAEQANGFGGVELVTDVLDTPAYAANEQQLKQRLQDAEAAHQEALEQESVAEAALASANEAVRNAELAVSKQDNLVRAAEATRKRSQQDRDSVYSEYQQALSERKGKARERLKANEQQQQQLTAQHSSMLAEVKDQQREAETEHQFHWQQILADCDDALERIERERRQARETAAEERRDLESWMQNELNQRGVDVDEIGQLKKRINSLSEKIQQTDAQRHKVTDYDRWYQRVYNGQKVEWQKSLATSRKTLSDAERELASQQSTFRELRESLGDKHAQLERESGVVAAHLQQLSVLQKSLQKLHLADNKTAPERQDEVSIAQRLSQAQALIQEREELLSDVRNYVERFDQLIAAQAGTGLSDTWERAREECATINAHGVKGVDHRRMVTHLSQMLNVIVPQKLQGLREQGRIFGADLSQYYHVLADIDKRIVSQSRRITSEVDKELYLDGVSDSAVKIRSRISELEFWPELEQFRRLYQDWMEQGATELPDEAYGNSMRRVLDILGRAALTGGISRLLDIELHLKEGNSDLIIRTDRQLNESSSHGMAYLILCKFLLAFTRLLRGDAEVMIHWPIDELGTLHQSNVKKIFDACQNNQINVLGAFPNPESEVLALFQHRYLIDKVTRQLQVVQPRVSPIQERIKARQAQEVSA